MRVVTRGAEGVREVAIKLSVAMGLMVLSVLCLRFTHNDFFFLTFIVAFLFSILYWIDFGGVLRDLENPRWWQRILGVLFGIPQALLGLTSIAIGIALVVWVPYRIFIEGASDYAGGLGALGLGASLISFGFFWVALAFKRSQLNLDASKDDY